MLSRGARWRELVYTQAVSENDVRERIHPVLRTMYDYQTNDGISRSVHIARLLTETTTPGSITVLSALQTVREWSTSTNVAGMPSTTCEQVSSAQANMP